MSILNLDEESRHKPVEPLPDPENDENDHRLVLRQAKLIDTFLVITPSVIILLWAIAKGGTAWGIGFSVVPIALLIGAYGIARKITKDRISSRGVFVVLMCIVFYYFAP